MAVKEMRIRDWESTESNSEVLGGEEILSELTCGLSLTGSSGRALFTGSEDSSQLQ